MKDELKSFMKNNSDVLLLSRSIGMKIQIRILKGQGFLRKPQKFVENLSFAFTFTSNFCGFFRRPEIYKN